MRTNQTKPIGSSRLDVARWILDVLPSRPSILALLLPLLLSQTAVVQAQFNYAITNGTITITRYTGAGGAVTIPSTINGLPVTRIGYSAFQNCFSLTGVTIPNSVTTIEDWAFHNCTSLNSVTIPNGVTSIGDGAFMRCTSLTNLTIPKSVSSIGEYAFSVCTSLPAINVDPVNSIYRSVGGVLFNKSLTNLVAYPAGRAGDYTIPNSVSVISGRAFERSTSLTNVLMGNSVTSIGDMAFDGCAYLASVTMPDSLTTIGRDAFHGCISLTNVLLPNSVTRIGSEAFMNCFSLTSVTIPDKITKIEFCAFAVCRALRSVTIPHGVTNIGEGAFEGCTNLTCMTLPDSVTVIEDLAFFGCSSLTNVGLPGTLTRIGDSAFAGCSGLPTIAIGRSVTRLGYWVFSSCPSLAAILVDPLNPSYSSVDGVLLDKTQTTLVAWPGGKAGKATIPNSVTSIGFAAFEGCSALTSITIADNVTNIGYYAFAGCTSLTRVTIGNRMISIGLEAFEYCYSLLALYFQGNAPGIRSSLFWNTTNATVYYLPGTTGWGPTFGGRPTALWVEAPTVLMSPMTQTAEAGSAVSLWAQGTNSLPLYYLWYFNGTYFISGSTNGGLELPNVQFALAGAYSVVMSNALGKVTSAPAMLSVIPPVERRWVPGLILSGQPGSALNLDVTEGLAPVPNWTPFDSVLLTSPSQWYFDLSVPLPPQRYFRASQTGVPGAPALDVHLVPALTLTGTVGSKLQVDGINQFGPTDAWFLLETVTLTNTSQLYFDVSVIGQPPRLYRLIQIP